MGGLFSSPLPPVAPDPVETEPNENLRQRRRFARPRTIHTNWQGVEGEESGTTKKIIEDE